MTLLAPFALVGLLLLAIPILVHLFKPRKMRQTPFSSLRWLKQTQQRLSRRIQWHQWLLFLVRASLIVLLVLALAKPLIGPSGTSRPTDRILILDSGPAMAFTMKDVPTPYERAQEIIEKWAAAAGPGDKTAILTTGWAPKIVAPLSTDPSAHLAALRTSRPRLSEAPVTSALPVVRAMMRPDAARDTELVFLSANLHSSWQQPDIQRYLQDWPGTTRVRIVDLGPGAANNAWIAGARLIERGPDQDPVLRVEIHCVGEAEQERDVRLGGIAGQPGDTQNVTLRAGQAARLDFVIPAGLPLRNQVAELKLEPADALPDDDAYFLPLEQGWAHKVLLIEPEPKEGGEGAGLFLRTALEALTQANHYALKVVRRSEKAVTAAEVQAADLTILAGVSDLSGAVIESLEARTREGGGVVLYLGPNAKAPLYRAKLFKAAQPLEGLLPVAIQPGDDAVKTVSVGNPTALLWSHPLLTPLRDPQIGDLPLTRFQRYAALEEKGKLDVAARSADGTALVIDHRLGAGQVLILNTTPNDEWTDLPRRRCFVPLVDGLLGYLSGGKTRRSFLVEQPILLPLPEEPGESKLLIVTPTGDKIETRAQQHGTHPVLAFDQAARAGRYTVERDGKAWLSFAVNTPRTASPLTPMDGKTLASWWAPAETEIVSGEAMLQQLEEGSAAWSLWPMLLFLAAVAFLTETLYVAWLCPRMGPRVVESQVPGRGILKPQA